MDYLSTAETAERLGVHSTTITRYVRRGLLRGRKVGKSRNSPVLIELSSVEAFEKGVRQEK